MKVDLIRKFKWYIVGFILVAIMLSVSLSFSAWDTLSFKAAMKAKGGDFNDNLYELGELEGDDANKNGIADVGDKVTFGDYYQHANTATKTPVRWIVVDITDRQGEQGEQLTLLAESVMAFGSFSGTYYYYYNSGTTGVWGGTRVYNPNYMESTVRAWLNSNDSNIRTDGGTQFSKTYDISKPQFRGFLEEAFSDEEREYILPKTISGMRGWNQSVDIVTPGRVGAYGSGNDKVWLPSYIEVYSNTGIFNGTTGSDNLNDKQFEYFASTSNTKIAKATAYASTVKSNYTMDTPTLEGSYNFQDSADGRNVWWWLRSPYPTLYHNALKVSADGSGINHGTANAHGGVRPAICLPL